MSKAQKKICQHCRKLAEAAKLDVQDSWEKDVRFEIKPRKRYWTILTVSVQDEKEIQLYIKCHHTSKLRQTVFPNQGSESGPYIAGTKQRIHRNIFINLPLADPDCFKKLADWFNLFATFG